MKGRKPKPTARQIAEGDPRKKGVHKLDEKLAAEPKASRGLPDCPRHLKGRARAAWNSWREELEAMKLDARCDAVMLEGACVAYARAVEADLMVTKWGITVEETLLDYDEGELTVLTVKTNPALGISNAAWRQVRAFCSDFGLSPVSRTRLTVEKKDPDEVDLAKLLSMPRKRA